MYTAWKPSVESTITKDPDKIEKQDRRKTREIDYFVGPRMSKPLVKQSIPFKPPSFRIWGMAPDTRLESKSRVLYF